MPKGVYKHKPHTAERKRKISESHKGKIVSEETRRKIGSANSIALKGKKQSVETIKKRSLSLLSKHKETEFGFRKGYIPWNKGTKGIMKPNKTSYKKGIKNRNWNNGSSFFPYSLDWTRTLRRSIRERDNYTCRICGKPQEDEALAVHHIDYKKQNCDPDNLITLCNSCYIKTNYNRKYWIELIEKFLKNK